MQIKEQQKDKRTNSFIRRSDNKQDNNFNNVRQRTNEMAEAEAEAIINELQDGKIVDNERIIALLDIFLNDKKINPRAMALLKEQCLSILIKNDMDKIMMFGEKLSSMGLEKMYIIVLNQFFNVYQPSKDMMKAENSLSVSGNLSIPENANFSKRQNDPKKFEGEIIPINSNDCKLTLIEHFYETLLRLKLLKQKLEIECLNNYTVNEQIEKEFENYFNEKFPPDIKKGLLETLYSENVYKIIEDENWLKYFELKHKISLMSLDEFEASGLKCEMETILTKIKPLLPKGKDLKRIIQYTYLLDKFEKRKPLADSSLYNIGKNKIEDIESELEESLYKDSLPLFSHKPCADDINQIPYQLGDCYFMASLVSLVHSKKYGPNFIMNMMRDNQNGTVTVRLYRPKYHNDDFSEIDEKGNIAALHPVYVNVAKRGLNKSNKSALWVNILQRAYVTIGGNFLQGKVNAIAEKKYEKYKNKIESRTRKIEDIGGGYSYCAMMTLTGSIANIFYDNKYITLTNKKSIKEHIKSEATLFNFIRELLNQDKLVAVSFKRDFKNEESKKMFAGHAYAIIEYNNKQEVVLVNPWQGNESIFCSAKTLLKNVNAIEVCE